MEHEWIDWFQMDAGYIELSLESHVKQCSKTPAKLFEWEDSLTNAPLGLFNNKKLIPLTVLFERLNPMNIKWGI